MMKNCIYCGKSETYAKGLCRNCYGRILTSGELNYSKRSVIKTKLCKEINERQKRLKIIEKAEQLLMGHKPSWGVNFYIFVADMLEGLTYSEIARKRGVSKQCVYDALFYKDKRRKR